MKKSKFTGEQIAYALRQADLGVTVAEVCRKMGISRTRRKPMGLDDLESAISPDPSRLQSLRESILADLALREPEAIE